MMVEAMFAAMFGLLFGSFLNVCIYRWTRDQSVVWPGSHCGTCGHPIHWYDNVPVASYIALGARCRHCRSAFSWQYPAVELLTGAAFFTAVYLAGPTYLAGKLAVFAWLQIGLIFADLDTRLLPDQFTKGGLALGFLFAVLAPGQQGLFRLLFTDAQPWIMSLMDSIFAAVFVSGALWLIGVLYSKVRKREGLGFGDVKMVAMIGAFLGFAPTLITIFAGSILGTVLGLGYIYLAKKDPATYHLPFASFLGAAALAVGFWQR